MVSDKVHVDTKDTSKKNVEMMQMRNRFDELYNNFQH